jgi:uncharacterized protein (TIGR03086 family)
VTLENDLAVLSRALDQLAGLLDELPAGALGARTPCEDWTVADLVDHVVAAPATFARMVRGESVDWSVPTPSAGPDPAAAFRSSGEDLLRSWREQDSPSGAPGVEWQCAELAVHTWDLATALGRSTGTLDPQPAEVGLAFLRANLTEDNRGPAFGPVRQVPEGADAYERVAAFAGRSA